MISGCFRPWTSLICGFRHLKWLVTQNFLLFWITIVKISFNIVIHILGYCPQNLPFYISTGRCNNTKQVYVHSSRILQVFSFFLRLYPISFFSGWGAIPEYAPAGGGVLSSTVFTSILSHAEYIDIYLYVFVMFCKFIVLFCLVYLYLLMKTFL